MDSQNLKMCFKSKETFGDFSIMKDVQKCELPERVVEQYWDFNGTRFDALQQQSN